MQYSINKIMIKGIFSFFGFFRSMTPHSSFYFSDFVTSLLLIDLISSRSFEVFTYVRFFFCHVKEIIWLDQLFCHLNLYILFIILKKQIRPGTFVKRVLEPEYLNNIRFNHHHHRYHHHHHRHHRHLPALMP